MKMTIIIIALALICFKALSDDASIKAREREILLENKKSVKIPQKELYDFPEVYHYNHPSLKDLDKSSGVYSDAYHTRYDTGRLSLSYGLSINIDELEDVIALDMNYMTAFEDSWREFWWGAQVKLTQTSLEIVTDNASPTTDGTQNMIFYGLGLGHSFKTIGKLFNSERLFEFVSFYVNYVVHRDNFAKEDYTGLGYNADYAFSYRSSKSFFWGGKVSYNWILVEQPAEGDESLSERSRVLGWSSLGLEIGYFF